MRFGAVKYKVFWVLFDREKIEYLQLLLVKAIMQNISNDEIIANVFAIFLFNY